MATPTKGAIIRTYSGAELDRIAGKAPAAAQSAAVDRYFNPPVAQFFPAGVPLKPVAPDGSTTARQWDFPSFLNLSYIPRSESGETAIDYGTLRRLASPEHGGLDILRLVIETRKDQMSAQRWSIRARGDKNNTGGKKAEQIVEWLKRPDGYHTFRAWMRMILEDHFVIDAVSIYQNHNSKRAKWELMDGATIKRLINSIDGRTPEPPMPAYQQIIKGMPAENYTTEELAYHIYNPMTNRLYGLSRVGQVLVTINTALNRALSQLEYFTSGTVPDAFMELPKEWDLRRIQQWTEWFNSEMEGQLGERRKVRFVPEGSKYTPTKTEILKDIFDEWLARIVCYCFSLPPQAFVKETNRSTAETQKEAAQEEGLEPTKLWFKDLMDDLFDRVGASDLEWYWEEEEIVDPEAKAAVIMSMYGGTTGTAKPIITLAEARDAMGYPPATSAQLDELQPPEPEPAPADGSAGGDGTNAKPKKPAADAKPDKKADKSEKGAGTRWNGRRFVPIAV